jgi:hypothetical protein
MSEKSKIKRALHSINNVGDRLLEKVPKSGSFDFNKSYESSELGGKYSLDLLKK